jgi:pyruvate dehydrogenase E1 component alpha subunit
MPETEIAKFSVSRLEILDEHGNADEALLPSLSDADIRNLHELLLLSRTFDGRALNLQREGRIGTYPSILGQEATQVGSAYALEKTDWVFPSFRETGVHITLGYPMDLLYLYWGGDERGLACPEGLNILPVCVSVAAQIPHAVGAAMAAKYRRDRVAVVAYFGDGATSKGDFHEAFNIAGVFKLPVVFICQNNQWAISMPRERQTAAATLAQKALAYGFAGVQVDGNDIFAVYSATLAALDKAKKGEGPTFIECFTYRVAHHTTADDAGRYRSSEEVESWKKKDPVVRLQLYMERRGLWSDSYQRELEAKVGQRIDEAVRKAEGAVPPQPREMFMNTAAGCTPRQENEMQELTDVDA